MIRKKIFHSALLFTAIVIMNSSCVTKQLTTQISIQNTLLSPQLTNKCWVLSSFTNSEKVKYELEYYEHRWKEYNIAMNFHQYYTDPVIKKIGPLTEDFYSEYKIDNNAADCNSALDIDEPSHLFFRGSDYPDFKSKKEVEYRNKLLHETESDATNPNKLNANRYYYEELYFEENGNFRKKVFYDNSCNFISITGKWMFRTPFAGDYASEIVLTYDNANRIGITPKDDVYLVTFYDDNVTFKKKYEETDSSLLAIRGHYSIIQDHIHYTSINPNTNEYNWDIALSKAGPSTPRYGKVENHGERVCTYALENPDDRIIINDPLTLKKTKEYISVAGYYKGNMRNCDDSTTTEQQSNNPFKWWEVYAGLNLSTKTGQNPNYNFVPGGQIGIRKPVHKFSENLELGVGAEYSMQGGKYASHEYVPGGDYKKSSRTSRLNYLNVPVMVRYQKARDGFFAEAGVQPGVLLSAKDKGTTTSDIKDEIKKFDVGIPIGVGYKSKNKFGVVLRVTPGLRNVNKDAAYNNRNMVASLRVSYSL